MLRILRMFVRSLRKAFVTFRARSQGAFPVKTFETFYVKSQMTFPVETFETFRAKSQRHFSC